MGETRGHISQLQSFSLSCFSPDRENFIKEKNNENDEGKSWGKVLNSEHLRPISFLRVTETSVIKKKGGGQESYLYYFKFHVQKLLYYLKRQ